MASLLGLPREIRDGILLHALRAHRDPPASPADLSNDGARHNNLRHITYLDAENEFIRFEKRPSMTTSLALRLTNRQLLDEVADSMRLEARRTDYHLDVMYLRDGSIWSTWTSVPVSSRRVNTVYATFRLFDCPDRLRTLVEGKPYPVFQGGDGGPAMFVHIVYHLLETFLNRGPWPLENDDDMSHVTSDGEQLKCHQQGLIIQNLVIDVLPSTDSGMLPLAAPTSNLRIVRQREERVFSPYARNCDPKDKSEGMQAAAQFSGFLQDYLSILASVDYHTHRYGKLLYDNIGTIDVRLDGESREMFDLARFPDRDWFSGSFYDRDTKDFAEWIVATAKRRRDVELPVAPLSAYLVKFLADRGLKLDDSRA